MKLDDNWLVNDRDSDGVTLWKMIGAVATVLAIIILLVVVFSDDPANPTQNDHARTCLNVTHGQIRTHDQFGGKYNRTTYWCEDRDGRITDIWFDS